MRNLFASLILLGAGACSSGTDHTIYHGNVDLAGAPHDMSAMSSDLSGPLLIAPLDRVVAATSAMPRPTVQYTATLNGASVAPAWTIDRGEIGTIDVASGLFTAAGTVAGKANVSAHFQGLNASTTVTVTISQSQNGDPAYPAPPPGPGGYGGVGGNGPGPAASPAQIAVLKGTATADANVHILYPYDGTVWPRGLLAPLLMWDPTAAHTFDAVMVKLHSQNFDYTGTFAANATPFMDLPIPKDVWHALTYSNGGTGDNVTVTIVFEDTSTGTPRAIGPYTLTWHVAPGTLKGTVYYNSYGTALLLNSGERSCGPGDACPGTRTGPYFGAGTLAIKPGFYDPVVAAGAPSGAPAGSSNAGCRVCHTVSANGSTLLTQHGANYNTSSSYALTMGGLETPVNPARNVAFPALAPDGTWFMSSSGGMINGDSTTRAYNLAGTLMGTQPTTPFTSFSAALPVFSPDGKHFAFNYQSSRAGGTTTNDGKSLAVLDYNASTQTFSAFRTLDTPGAGIDSWSSFLPTNDAVVFERELTTNEWGYTRNGNTGELWWVKLGGTAAIRLDKLNGKGYLPNYGTNHAADDTVSYEPTVNPVVSGGYAWVVFTSRRAYGNVATIDPWMSDPRNYDWTEPQVAGITTKKLWVAAIDINAPATADPSHPAFYLPAQELLAGNARGYWTVDPCHKDGTSCQTGDECCGGYCRPGGDAGLICTNVQPMCAQEFERCTTTANCCGAAQGITCVNGFCSRVVPIQ